MTDLARVERRWRRVAHAFTLLLCWHAAPACAGDSVTRLPPLTPAQADRIDGTQLPT